MSQPTKTECCQGEIGFQDLDSRRVEIDFDAGHVTSDAGMLLLREVDAKLGLIGSMAMAFADKRDPDRVEHTVEELLRQRIMAIAAGYEDLIDHDRLRHDPMMALVSGKCDVTGGTRRRESDRGKACAGKSTLNRLELSPDLAVTQADRYHKITWESEVLDALLVRVFIESHSAAPEELVVDLDTTDDPLHGQQEGRFFHGHYDNWCYLPFYIVCGEHVLCARLRTADKDPALGWQEELPRVVAQIRAAWPQVRIIVRADSGFCREPLMKWCESNQVDYVLGLAKNKVLERAITTQLEEAKAEFAKAGQAARHFAELEYRTQKTWSRTRRVVAKAEWIEGGEEGRANPRFVVSSLGKERLGTRALYEELYCGRGDMENRIKEQQLDLFADRTSTAFIKSNQLRLYFSCFARVLVVALRRLALASTDLAKAAPATIRTHLFKAGALIRVSVRRVLVSISTGWPMRDLFLAASRALFNSSA
jgi:hypothetical protein